MPVNEHVAHVPYHVLLRHCQEAGGWTCVACGGAVRCRFFGHDPQPRVPLFECESCGRRSDGCQTFEGHHLLYRYCPLEDNCATRCGYWHCDWHRPQGVCPVCGGHKTAPA
jgi:hypothetical protein